MALHILLTFHNAKGFKDGQIPAVHGTPAIIGVDAPVLVILQNKPAGVELSEHGLALDFGEKPAGVVQVMPLFGVRKIKGEETAAWEKGVPAEVTERCQRLARMSRFYPISCKEEYRLGADTSVSIRQSFDYLEIQDEWGTKGERVAPLPPALGIALMFGKRSSLPASVAPSVADLSYFTPNGPLLVCQGDHHILRFDGARRYADETLETRRSSSPRGRASSPSPTTRCTASGATTSGARSAPRGTSSPGSGPRPSISSPPTR